MSLDGDQPQSAAPKWMTIVLLLAALYNITWGTFVVLFPEALFRWIDMQPPLYPEIWQVVGMVVGVYGVGYAIAAFDPYRHYPIVLVGLLGKLFGPIGFLQAVLQDRLPWEAGLVNITNDLIWWIPFSIILWQALQYSDDVPLRKIRRWLRAPFLH